MQRWVKQMSSWSRADTRNVAYLSAEFLARPDLGNNLFKPRDYRECTLGDGRAGLTLEQ